MHIFGLISRLSWTFKAIGTQRAALAWLKKEEELEVKEEQLILATVLKF